MEITQTTFGPQTYLGVRKTVTFDEMRDKSYYEKTFGKIMSYLGSQNAYPAGPPVNMYFSWDVENEKTDMGTAFPVNTIDTVDNEELQLIRIPESKVVHALHRGDYMELKTTHDAIMAYMKENELEIDTVAIEEYVSDPAKEPDKSKWETNIYYTIK